MWACHCGHVWARLGLATLNLLEIIFHVKLISSSAKSEKTFVLTAGVSCHQSLEPSTGLSLKWSFELSLFARLPFFELSLFSLPKRSVPSLFLWCPSWQPWKTWSVHVLPFSHKKSCHAQLPYLWIVLFRHPSLPAVSQSIGSFSAVFVHASYLDLPGPILAMVWIPIEISPPDFLNNQVDGFTSKVWIPIRQIKVRPKGLHENRRLPSADELRTWQCFEPVQIIHETGKCSVGCAERLAKGGRIDITLLWRKPLI